MSEIYIPIGIEISKTHRLLCLRLSLSFFANSNYLSDDLMLVSLSQAYWAILHTNMFGISVPLSRPIMTTQPFQTICIMISSTHNKSHNELSLLSHASYLSITGLSTFSLH